MTQERATNGAGAADDPDPPYIFNGGRREYQNWFKIQVVQECMAPGASVSVVARRYDLNNNMVFRWRREVRRGLLHAPFMTRPEPFASVGVIGIDGKLEPVPPTQAAPTITQPPPAEVKPGFR